MGILDFFKKNVRTSERDDADPIIDQALEELGTMGVHYWSVKPKDFQATETLLALPSKEKIAFILSSIREIHEYHKGRSIYNSGEPGYLKTHLRSMYISHLFKVSLTLDEDDVSHLIHAFTTYKQADYSNFTSWPWALFINQVGRNFGDGQLPGKVRESLSHVKSLFEKHNRQDKDIIKLIDKINNLVFQAGSENDVRPVLFLGKDEFVEYANGIITNLPDSPKRIWYKLISHAQKASGSKPSVKYLDAANALMDEIGVENFKSVAGDWFEFITRLKEVSQEHSYVYNNTTYVHTTHELLSATTNETLKGFVWMCARFHDSKTLQIIASLCERCFRKIPNKGPAAAAIGNACLFTLYKSKGLEGIAHLSRLNLRIKQSSTQKLIQKYLADAAMAKGISVAEIEDLAVDDYDLAEGKREFEIEGYRAVISIQRIGDAPVSWFKPDNTPQKSVPAFIKEKHAKKLTKIKDTQKSIETTLTAQRDRIDRMLRTERKMTWPYFNEHYHNHGLTAYLSRKLLWKLEKEGISHTALYLNGTWITLHHGPIIPDDTFAVSLWHPAMASVKEIREWRELLIKEKIVQPVKQAFREVYLLTDAEVNTRTYSNRMAAHILKQHQFNSLAKIRGWKYALQGAFDNGSYNGGAELDLPEYNLMAEFWVSEVNAENAMNDTGIWNYVSTDQVRFVNLENRQPINLADVPPVIFSEVMRDVDLFVGVASVGNDPTWQDSGEIPAYRDYWQAYSFGDLNEIAKTRKEILENLIPRLKIASVTSIREKFVVVQGKKRTYKIHIGSTNILMEPNDQYLCIVPDRSKKDTTENVFLPFEGDNGLSVILSKAMLLAKDDKINDPTILSQINYK